MSGPRWPAGTVRALLATDHVSEATRRALVDRLAAPPAPSFLDPAAFAALDAACRRLVPPEPAVPVAAFLDARLAASEGDGWRYDALPPDGDAARRGLAALDAEAAARHGGPFAALDGPAQDALLSDVQRGAVGGPAWDGLPPALWFRDLLAGAVEAYYSHPLAQEAIGYVGMADRPGWTRIGPGEREAREPEPMP